MKRTSPPYVRYLLFLSFGLIVMAGVAGLKTVWLRQQIGFTAGEIRMLELRIHDLERSLARIDSEIAAALNPMSLRRQAGMMDLSLRRPEERQVVRLRENSALLQQFAGRSGTGFDEESEALSDQTGLPVQEGGNR